jgi:hypothetical protein
MWLRFDATTLWHFDAAEWAPSTTSLAGIATGLRDAHFAPECRHPRARPEWPLSADFVAEVI